MNYRVLLTCVVGVACLGARLCAGDACCATTQETPRETPSCCAKAGTEAGTDLAAKWGIQVASLRMTAGDRMVDFRYKVIDPTKAAVLGQHDSKAYLIDQATGTKLRVPSSPKVGALRSRADQPIAGTVYTVLFGNAAGLVRAGSLVTIEIGDFRATNLKVE